MGEQTTNPQHSLSPMSANSQISSRFNWGIYNNPIDNPADAWALCEALEGMGIESATRPCFILV